MTVGAFKKIISDAGGIDKIAYVTLTSNQRIYFDKSSYSSVEFDAGNELIKLESAHYSNIINDNIAEGKKRYDYLDLADINYACVIK